MSERLRSQAGTERTARVWQPTDFLGAEGKGAAFVAKRWSSEGDRRFTPAPEPASAVLSLQPPEELAPPEPEPAKAPARTARATPEAEEPAQPASGVSQKDLEDARMQAYAKGLEHGRQEGQQKASQAHEAAQARLQQGLQALSASLEDLRQSPEQLYEPLKRLALHLAEQLVLAELSQSPQAIERLVRRCVDELGSGKAVPVVVELNPDDLALLEPHLAALASDAKGAGEATASAAPPWQLQADSALAPGSVRASAQDAVVSDLIEHRLDALARQLRVDAQRAARQSAFQPERLASRRAEVDQVLDAQPRMADAPRGTRFAPVVEAEAAVAPDPVLEPVPEQGPVLEPVMEPDAAAHAAPDQPEPFESTPAEASAPPEDGGEGAA